jgi:hypothetical protein
LGELKTTNAVSENPSPSQQKLGEENLRAGETLTIAGFAVDGKDWDGIYVGRRKGGDLVSTASTNNRQLTWQPSQDTDPQNPAPYNTRIAHM